MKTSELQRLDQQTPRFPELRAQLADPPSITVGGVTRPLGSDDPQGEIVTIAADRARQHNAPIRLTVTVDNGAVDHLIVTADGAVHQLSHQPSPGQSPNSPEAGHAAALPMKKARRAGRRPGAAKARKPASKRSGMFGFLPPATARRMKWALVAAAATLTVLAVVLLLVVQGSPPAATAPRTQATPTPTTRPAPAPGQLYTTTAPPGWSQAAWWALPIATDSTPVTDESSGLTALLSATDNMTSAPALSPAGDAAQHEPNYLVVVDAAGRARWSTPLDDGAPRFGPVLTTVDGARVVLITDSRSITYWPLTGGKPTTVVLPKDVRGTINTAGDSALITLGGDRVAYLQHGQLQIVQTLPRTEPAFALDGAAVVIEPESGTWWTLTESKRPVPTRPKAPAAHLAVHDLVGITPTAAVIAWADPRSSTVTALTIVAYDRATGAEIARTSTKRPGDVQPGRSAASNPTVGLTAAGTVVVNSAPDHHQLAIVAGISPEAVYDRVYARSQGAGVVIGSDLKPVTLPDGTIQVVGYTENHLMAVSQDALYALQPAPRAAAPATKATPSPAHAPTTVTATKTVAPPTTTQLVTATVTKTISPATTSAARTSQPSPSGG